MYISIIDYSDEILTGSALDYAEFDGRKLDEMVSCRNYVKDLLAELKNRFPDATVHVQFLPGEGETVHVVRGVNMLLVYDCIVDVWNDFDSWVAFDQESTKEMYDEAVEDKLILASSDLARVMDTLYEAMDDFPKGSFGHLANCLVDVKDWAYLAKDKLEKLLVEVQD